MSASGDNYNQQRVCPMVGTRTDGAFRCTQSVCAWWLPYYDMCAVAALGTEAAKRATLNRHTRLEVPRD